jgi:hypothetical protein
MSLGGFGVVHLRVRLFGSREETLLTRRPIHLFHSEHALVTRVVDMDQRRPYVSRTSFINRSKGMVARAKFQSNSRKAQLTTFPQQT